MYLDFGGRGRFGLVGSFKIDGLVRALYFGELGRIKREKENVLY